MAKMLRCEALFPDCPAEVRGESDEEIMHQASQHARDEHGLRAIDERTEAALMAAIRQA